MLLVQLVMLVIVLFILCSPFLLSFRFLKRKALWVRFAVGFGGMIIILAAGLLGDEKVLLIQRVILITLLFILCSPFLLSFWLLNRKALWVRFAVGFGGMMIILAGGLFGLQIVTLEEVPGYFRSLPTDEQMIANFYEHREDFERLAKIYREDASVPTDSFGYLIPTPEIKATMKRIHVTSISDDDVIWMPPDPYSLDPDFLRKKSRLDAKWHSPEARKFNGVFFYYAQKKVESVFCLTGRKDYYFFPFPPKVENGVLHVPATLLTGGDGPVVETLNGCLGPDTIPRWECAYRRIEPNWYIKMCNF